MARSCEPVYAALLYHQPAARLLAELVQTLAAKRMSRLIGWLFRRELPAHKLLPKSRLAAMREILK